MSKYIIVTNQKSPVILYIYKDEPNLKASEPIEDTEIADIYLIRFVFQVVFIFINF